MKRITRKLVLKALTSERRRPIFFDGWDQDLSGVPLHVFIYAIDGSSPKEYNVTAIPVTGNPAGEFTVVYADFTLVDDLPAGEYFLKVATADVMILRYVLLLFSDDAHSFRVIDVVTGGTVLWDDDGTVLWDDNNQPLVF